MPLDSLNGLRGRLLRRPEWCLRKVETVRHIVGGAASLGYLARLRPCVFCKPSTERLFGYVNRALQKRCYLILTHHALPVDVASGTCSRSLVLVYHGIREILLRHMSSKPV